MLKPFKFLIETNLFIAIAAVTFMWANIFLLDLKGQSFLFLSLQVFFSTWFVYQISRWVYFKKGEYASKQEIIVQWFEKYPKITKSTIYLSFLLTVIFTCFLKWKTIFVLCFLGFFSVLYPVPILKFMGINTRLRDFPFVKLFLIALVWSVTSVILPITEAGIAITARKDVMVLLIAQFIYILFITLPFDINDAETDKTTDIKTIPSVFGINASKTLAFVFCILYIFLILFIFMLINWNHAPNKFLSDYSMLSILIMVILLQVYTFLKADKVSKFWIKMVYDGSMIVYFLLLLLLNFR